MGRQLLHRSGSGTGGSLQARLIDGLSTAEASKRALPLLPDRASQAAGETINQPSPTYPRSLSSGRLRARKPDAGRIVIFLPRSVLAKLLPPPSRALCCEGSSACRLPLQCIGAYADLSPHLLPLTNQRGIVSIALYFSLEREGASSISVPCSFPLSARTHPLAI